MSFAQLKDQILQLPSAEQRKLMGFLVALQTDRDPSFTDTLTAKIDDHDPDHWVELDDLQKRLSSE